MSEVLKTVYHDIHLSSGAKMVEFAGYSMPIKYEGIKPEHMAVRTAAGLFDVSHMGEIVFKGDGAVESIDYMVTNDVSSLEVGHALYTPICNHEGGIVDDCIVYKKGEKDILVVVNASNIEKDFNWFKKNTPDVVPENISDTIALIAIQGPKSQEILARVSNNKNLGDIPGFGLGYVNILGEKILIARTGYTGEDGFEIFFPNSIAVEGWKLLMEKGADLGIKPAGLGARDTLRLEAKLWLYGNDINDKTTPIEAGMGFAVKLNKENFIGKDVLVKQKAEKPDVRLIGFKTTGKGIPRKGYKIHLPKTGEDESFGKEIGEVMSGTMVPFLKETVGMGYVSRKFSKSGREIVINVRGKSVPAVIFRGPFYKRS
jgi:glycine cleavage system T protein (aminomethyltransferase)